METCKDGNHEHVTPDFFARDFPRSRALVGDCYCQDCKQPLPYFWNGGKPIPAEPEEQAVK